MSNIIGKKSLPSIGTEYGIWDTNEIFYNIKNNQWSKKLLGWNYGMEITIPSSQINEDLINFPVTIYLNSSKFDFTKAKSDGADIRFTDKDLNQYKFEKVEYSSVNSFAHFTVKVPYLYKNQDNYIYMWYGNSSAYNTSIESWRDQTGKTLTYVGNAKMVSGQFNDARVAYFDGSGDNFQVLFPNDFNFGTGNFTVEWWQNLQRLAVGDTILTFRNGANVVCYLGHCTSGTTVQACWSGTAAPITSWDTINQLNLGAPNLDTWEHCALVRNGTTFTTYKNGVAVATATSSNIFGNTPDRIHIGEPLLGSVTGLRLTKGLARYTSNFTPSFNPTIDNNQVVFCSNFDTVYDSNYIMVNHMTEVLTDASGLNNSATNTGTTNITTNYGQARVFGGTSYLTLTYSNKLSMPAYSDSERTVTMLIYPTTINATMATLLHPTGWSYGLWFHNTIVRYHVNPASGAGYYMDWSAIPTINTYSVMTCSHSSNTSLKYYLNGVDQGQTTLVSFTQTPSDTFRIGQMTDSTTYPYTGYIKEMRFSDIQRRPAWIKLETLLMKNEILIIRGI